MDDPEMRRSVAEMDDVTLAKARVVNGVFASVSGPESRMGRLQKMLDDEVDKRVAQHPERWTPLGDLLGDAIRNTSADAADPAEI